MFNVLNYSKPRLISDSESNDEGADTDGTTKSNVLNSSDHIDLTNIPLYLPKTAFEATKMDSIISIVGFNWILQLLAFFITYNN